jgi:hypothetical protein
MVKTFNGSPINLGTNREQKTDNIDLLPVGGDHQWSVPMAIGNFYVSAIFHKKFNYTKFQLGR